MNEAETKCDLCGQLGHDWRSHMRPSPERRLVELERRVTELAELVEQLSKAMASRDQHIADAAKIFADIMGHEDMEDVVAWLERPEVERARRR